MNQATSIAVQRLMNEATEKGGARHEINGHSVRCWTQVGARNGGLGKKAHHFELDGKRAAFTKVTAALTAAE